MLCVCVVLTSGQASSSGPSACSLAPRAPASLYHPQASPGTPRLTERGPVISHEKMSSSQPLGEDCGSSSSWQSTRGPRGLPSLSGSLPHGVRLGLRDPGHRSDVSLGVRLLKDAGSALLSRTPSLMDAPAPETPPCPRTIRKREDLGREPQPKERAWKPLLRPQSSLRMAERP